MTQVRDTKPSAVPSDLQDMSDHDLDTGLAEYLEGQSPISMLYRDEANALPPAHVDSKVLFAARQRAEETKDGTTRSWLSPTRWFGSGLLVPAATACGVVGVASVMFMLQPSETTPVPASGVEFEGAPPSYNSPESYMQEIQELRRSGKLDRADQLVKEMSKAYPDLEIPADIRSRVDD